LKKQLRKGADINCRGHQTQLPPKLAPGVAIPPQYDFTPLMVASANGHLHIVSYLIEARADLDVKAEVGD